MVFVSARAAALDASSRAHSIEGVAELLGFVVIHEPPSPNTPRWEAIGMLGESTRIFVRVFHRGRYFDQALAEALGYLAAPTLKPEGVRVWARSFARALLEAFPSRFGRPMRILDLSASTSEAA